MWSAGAAEWWLRSSSLIASRPIAPPPSVAGRLGAGCEASGGAIAGDVLGGGPLGTLWGLKISPWPGRSRGPLGGGASGCGCGVWVRTNCPGERGSGTCGVLGDVGSGGSGRAWSTRLPTATMVDGSLIGSTVGRVWLSSHGRGGLSCCSVSGQLLGMFNSEPFLSLSNLSRLDERPSACQASKPA